MYIVDKHFNCARWERIIKINDLSLSLQNLLQCADVPTFMCFIISFFS